MGRRTASHLSPVHRAACVGPRCQRAGVHTTMLFVFALSHIAIAESAFTPSPIYINAPASRLNAQRCSCQWQPHRVHQTHNWRHFKKFRALSSTGPQRPTSECPNTLQTNRVIFIVHPSQKQPSPASPRRPLSLPASRRKHPSVKSNPPPDWAVVWCHLFFL